MEPQEQPNDKAGARSSAAAANTATLDMAQEKEAARSSRLMQTLFQDDSEDDDDNKDQKGKAGELNSTASGHGTTPTTTMNASEHRRGSTINVNEERAAALTSVVAQTVVPDDNNGLSDADARAKREINELGTGTLSEADARVKREIHELSTGDNQAGYASAATATADSDANFKQRLLQEKQGITNQTGSSEGTPGTSQLWNSSQAQPKMQDDMVGAYAVSPDTGDREESTLEQLDIAILEDPEEEDLPLPAPTPQQVNTAGLVEARPVDEPFEISLGIPQDMDARKRQENRDDAFRTWTIRLIALFCLVLVIVVVVVVLTVPQESITVVAAPTPAPSTAAPTTAAPTYAFTPLLPSFTLEAMANDPNSPQALAYQWLLEDPLRETHSEEKQVQRMALATFFYATNGESWTFNTNWIDHAVDECEWYSKALLADNTGGSVCDEDGKYLELVLTLNELGGILPKEVVLLSKLKILDVATNEIGGTIHTEISTMDSLKFLAIDDTDIGGTLPTELGLMTNLEILACHTNPKMEGSIPTFLGNMVSLRILQFYDNPLMTGTLPSELGKLSNLTWLRVHFPSMSGTIPTEFGTMVAMETFDMRGTQLSGTIPSEVGHWRNARFFYILWNSLLGGTIPSELGSLTMVEALQLAGLELTGTVPSEVWALPSMKRLLIGANTALSGTIATEVGLATSLVWMEGE